MSNIKTLNRGGRKPRAKNKATIAKEALASAAVKALSERLSPEAISGMTPLQVMLAIMTASFEAGDLATARICAESAAPYCHARKSPEAMQAELPDDLLPDRRRRQTPMTFRSIRYSGTLSRRFASSINILPHEKFRFVQSVNECIGIARNGAARCKR